MKTSMVGLLCLFTVAVAPPVSADDNGDHGDHGLLVTHDSAGLLASASSGNFDPGPPNGFFTDLGTNGRTCNTCHVKENAWTITGSRAIASQERSAFHTE